MQCRSYATAVATALVLLLTVGLFLNNAPYNLVIDLPTLPFGAKPITHVVLLEFKPSIGAGEIGKVGFGPSSNSRRRRRCETSNSLDCV